MNEEQSEELLTVLKEIRDFLKPTESKEELILKRLNGAFFDSLDEAQKEYIKNIQDPITIGYNIIKRRYKVEE